MEFKIGDKIKHKHYGTGTIVNKRPSGAWTVMFDKENWGLHDGGIGKNYRCWWCSSEHLELVEINMKKEDLKNNDIVTLRNGDRLLFFNGDFYDLGGSCCHYIDDLDDYGDDLRTWDRDCKEYDIVKVERPAKYETVFEREEVVQELTVDEISERLGYKVKVVGEDR